MSEIAGISAMSMSVGMSMSNSLAAQAATPKNPTVQDEIAATVIISILGQQKMIADQLIEMMKQNLIDIYA